MNRQSLLGLRNEERRTPLLGKGGVAAPINKISRSFLSRAQTGWFVQTSDYRKLNEPPRPRFSKERGHFLDRAATPPLPRRGVPFGCFATFQVHCVFINPTFCLPRSGGLKFVRAGLWPISRG